MTTVVTGGSGHLAAVLAQLNPKLLLLDRKEMDITKPDMVETVLTKHSPDVVIHTAGYTNLTWIEKNRSETYRCHVEGTSNVARICRRIGAKLVYTSTDYVFSGEKSGGMYTEDELADPLSFYGLSKAQSEEQVRKASRWLIVRGTMKDPGWKHPVAPTDMWESVLLRQDYARMLLMLIDVEAEGVFHIGGPRVNIYDYAKTQRPDVQPCLRKDLPFPLPKDCSLDTTRASAALTLHHLLGGI